MNKKASFELSVILILTLAVVIFSAGVLVFDQRGIRGLGSITGYIVLNAPGNISSCNTTINASGEYTLNQSLTSCSGNGVIIDASDVVLDCAGYTIDGIDQVSSVGVLAQNYPNVTIKNCNIQDFDQGIKITGSASSCTVLNNNITSNNLNSGHGIALGTANNLVEGNTLDSNRLGIYMMSGSSGVIISNTVNNSILDGIQYASTGVTNITNNTVTNSGRDGIRLGSEAFRVWHNNIYNNTNNVYVGAPDEIFYNNEGNYWGHSCPNVFTAGVDSNNVNVIDSYPYDTMNGWLTGDPADCVVCGKDINSSTTLTYDLTNCSGNGLNIGTAGVTLDCNGYTISGSGSGYGVNISNANSTTVKNCVIHGFRYSGVLAELSNNVNITNNTIYNITDINSELISISGNESVYVYVNVKGNNLTGGDSGVFCSYSSTNIIDNDIQGQRYGIENGFACGTAQIIGNRISGCTQAGAFFSSSHNVTGNNITGNNFGIWTTSSPKIYHNNIYNNTLNINSTVQLEVSLSGQGNYWGRSSCPVFIAGNDSNAANVVDSYGYNSSDGWDTGDPTDCCGLGGICGCGHTVSGSITLTTDLSASGTCFTVGADGITIDCDGHTITGAQSGSDYGISSFGYDSITIKNCNIENFSSDIYMTNSIGHTILNNNFSKDNGVSEAGLRASNINNSLIKNNRMFDNYRGIYLYYSDNNTIEDNTVYNNSDNGIYLDWSDNNTLKNNIVFNNSYSGMLIYYSDNNNVTGGEIYNNNLGEMGGGGIYLQYTVYSHVSGIYIHNNKRNGISGWDNDNSVIESNNIDSNCGGNAGISLWYATNVTIKNNNITNGTGYGIELHSTSATILNNNINNNSNDGIYIYNSDNVTIDNNDILSNNNRGIFIGYSTNDITISNNNIKDNCEGVFLEWSVATIIDTDFTNNNCSGNELTGLYVSSTSTAHLRNGDFINNGEYGIYDQGPNIVNWNITEEITCKNNNLTFYGPYPNLDGGKIILDNCVIRVNNSVWNISSGLEGFDKYNLNVIAGTTTGLGNSSVGFSVEVSGNENDTVDLYVQKYSSNPGGSGYALTPLGKYLRFETSSPINVSWIIIKVYYTDAEVAAAGLDENSLRLEYYNASSGKWTKYDPPNGGVNTAENYVWAKTTHFSIWGVFGSTPTAPSAPSRAAGITGIAGKRYTLGEEPLTVTLSSADKVDFEVKGQFHTLQLYSLSEDYVVLSLASAIEKIRVELGETTNIDVNNDGIYDLAITLNKVNKYSAELTFQKIVEKAPVIPEEVAPPIEEVPPVEEKPITPEEKVNYILLGILAVLAVIAVIIVVTYYIKEKK